LSARFKIGDLVCERHQPDWVGIVLDIYTKNLGTDYTEDIVIVDWIKNSNNTSSSNREELSSKYLNLVSTGNQRTDIEVN